MMFAVAGSQPDDLVSVVIRPFGPGGRPQEAYNVFLPPSFAGRAWRQRGFFSWQPVEPQSCDDPSVRVIDGRRNQYRSRAADHHRITFSVTLHDIAWANLRLQSLYREEFGQLLDFVSWCLKSAGISERTPWSTIWNDRDFVAECHRQRLEPPTVFTSPAPAVATRENVPEMLDYLGIMALRRRPSGGLAYHGPALLTALCALPRKSFPKGRRRDVMPQDLVPRRFRPILCGLADGRRKWKCLTRRRICSCPPTVTSWTHCVAIWLPNRLGWIACALVAVAIGSLIRRD